MAKSPPRWCAAAPAVTSSTIGRSTPTGSQEAATSSPTTISPRTSTPRTSTPRRWPMTDQSGTVRIALLSPSDTDLLSARSAEADYALGNPSRLDVEEDLPRLPEGPPQLVISIPATVRSSPGRVELGRAPGVPHTVPGGGRAPHNE